MCKGSCSKRPLIYPSFSGGIVHFKLSGNLILLSNTKRNILSLLHEILNGSTKNCIGKNAIRLSNFILFYILLSYFFSKLALCILIKNEVNCKIISLYFAKKKAPSPSLLSYIHVIKKTLFPVENIFAAMIFGLR